MAQSPGVHMRDRQAEAGHARRARDGARGAIVIAGISLGCMLLASHAMAETAMSYAEALRSSVQQAASVQVAHIIANALIRIAAIAAGAYIVWLGHNTMVRGIKGEFEFEGSLGKLKGSTPGLLFVLLGVAAIGWSLGTELKATLDISAQNPKGESSPAGAGPAPTPGELPVPEPPS